MVSKEAEYASLRQEMINLIDLQNNYIIAMYTITVTILGIAYERRSHILFLLPYVILFSFQRIISAKRDGLLRIAAYVSVFLEKDDGWESRYSKVVNETCYKNNKVRYTKFMNIITGRMSSFQLGFLCSISSIITCCINKNINLTNLSDISLKESSTLICSVALFAILYYWNKDSLKAMDKRTIYIEALKKKRNEIEKLNG